MRNTSGAMSQYSYPLLQSDEILTVLRELTIDATSDDLINPTPQKAHVGCACVFSTINLSIYLSIYRLGWP